MRSFSGPLKQAVRKSIECQRERNNHPPRLRVSPTISGQSTRVFYLCPDRNIPSGGIRTIYQHVDTLNSIGVDAFVLHHRRGFVCTWFEHRTKVVSAADITMGCQDLLVFPELYVPYLDDIPSGPRLVLFNQGTYVNFSGRQSVSTWRKCVQNGKFEGILVVSLDNLDYIKFAFPGVRVERVRNSIDGDIFQPSAGLPRRRIAVMPRSRGKDLCRHVLGLLELRGALVDWEVVNINNRTQTETREILKSSAIFLSFSEREGFGLPPAEAMACGSYVVGFTGLGGREFFYPSLCTQVEEGNVLALAQAAGDAMMRFESDASGIRGLALKASTIIRDEYSMENQRKELRNFFGPATRIR
jgi:glycosyltransferase involved in cell wall biosynthesis